ncbi:MAG: flagellar biosynthesis regulator FlaF [Pseudomonadota bacterium]
MFPNPEAGYGQIRRDTASPRQVEYRVLTSIAAEIEAADPATPQGYRELALALQRNKQLWEALAVDLSNPDNPLDDSLKANLIGLAGYSVKTGQAVLQGEEDRLVLVNINRTVAAGLKPATEVAA